MIYIACPYWHIDPGIRAYRRKVAVRYSDELTRKGILNYSPLTYTQRYENEKIPENYWIRHGLKMVRACEEIHVLCVDGWDKSSGIRGELAVASENGLKIVYREVV